MSNVDVSASSDSKQPHSLPGRGLLFSRLASDGSLSLFGEFSGQGRPWLPDLRTLHKWATEHVSTHPSLLQLIEDGCALVLELSESDELASTGVFKQGMEVMKWIREPEQAPQEAYLSSPSVSYCMIYLTELAHFLHFCCLLNHDVPTVGSWFKVGGLTGHSQGVVCALAVAMAKSTTHFVEVAIKLLAYMLFHGVRVQQAYPTKTLPAKIVRDAAVPPTPMLSVSGLPYSLLHKFIEKTNATFGASSVSKKLYLSLINGVDQCSVTGHPYALVNLQSMLKTIQAEPNDNQDRVPFSKRKLVFHTNFLPVGAPFHCPLLQGAVDALLEDLKTQPALAGLDSIRLQDLHGIPVWTTHDNTILSDASGRGSIIEQLVRMQCIQPVHWGLTCKKLITEVGVTHVVDFSRGGAAASLARLTHRNLDGTGIQILLAATEESDDNTSDPLNTINLKGRAAYLDLPNVEDLDEGLASFPAGINWKEKYGPKLIRLKDGSLALRTRYTDLMNRPPLFVSGMTPTTAEEVLCSAVINAGYSIELAGGGQHTAQLFRHRISSIAARTQPGEGIHVNLLFLNPYLWNMQFPLCLQLKREEGYNIECITIGAGVPGVEKATEICDSMLEVGISKLGFKPGTVGAIHAVVAVAAANPRMQIILQWTGGRSGGHHSMEDEHVPLLQTYALIRTCPNICLVMGGGMGDAKSAYPYLSGEWSLQFFKPPMPVDGLLFGSRMMVALEAPTALAVKQLIVATPGVKNEKEWEQSLNGIAGGVVTIQSELGEPIHKIANKGTLFWRELDEKFFSITDKAKYKAAIMKNKNYIISKLNDCFQKPYFGRKKDGLVVDLPAMTYEEVTLRLLEFFHPQVGGGNGGSSQEASAICSKHSGPGGWIDITYFFKFRTWVMQVVARFAGMTDGDSNASVAWSKEDHTKLEQLLQPTAPIAPLLSFLTARFPACTKETLAPEDEDFFLMSVCMQPGKPVNFVPVIDENLKLWFKKDSLWFSEDLRSIPNQDVQRCAILHSPVSAAFSTKVNESVKEILDGIHSGIVDIIQKNVAASGDASDEIEQQLGEQERVPEEAWEDELRKLKEQFEAAPPSNSAEPAAPLLCLSLPSSLHVSSIDVNTWNELFASAGGFWSRSMFRCSVLLRNKKHVPNHLRQMLAPRAGATYALYEESMRVWDATVLGGADAHTPVVECSYHAASRTITVSIANPRTITLTSSGGGSKGSKHEGGVSHLKLTYTLHSSKFQYRTFGLLLEQDWNEKVKAISNFYKQLWLTPGASASSSENEKASDDDSTRTITSQEVKRFMAATSDDNIQETPDGRHLLVPLDYGIVLAWTPIVRSMIDAAEQLGGDLLNLVHLSNEYKLVDESDAPLMVGDKVQADARVQGVWREPEGHVITVVASIRRLSSAMESESDGSQPKTVLKLTSRFAIRPSTGSLSPSNDSDVWFRKQEFEFKFFHTTQAQGKDGSNKDKDAPVQLNKAEVATLLSKKWHDLDAAKLDAAIRETRHSTPALASYLLIRLSQHETSSRIETRGNIFLYGRSIATIESVRTSHEGLACPVVGWARRKCVSSEAKPSLTYPSPQHYPQRTIMAPKSNRAYAIASTDVNVIHLQPYFLSLANLPDTIVHGMFSSAKMRQLIADASGAAGVMHGRARLVQYKAEFTGMVLPAAQLTVSIALHALQDGLKQVVGELRRADTEQLVLRATALVQQPPIAYVFTGQGSAQVNMGMDLYGTSTHARAVWDEADSFLQNQYGFSILHVVRNNPKTLTVHFPKSVAGTEMKMRYASLGLIKPAKKAAASGKEEQASNKGQDVPASVSAAPATPPSPTNKDLDPSDYAHVHSYTFQSSEGLLFATQFQQPAILLQETAAFSDLKAKGAVQRTARLSGHSLGEYCCLSACLSSIHVSALAEVVFLRGLTMQNAVARDSLNRSRYGMVAASPDRVGSFFTESQLQALVLALESEVGELLQVVNYNVYNAQYVVAGGLVALEALKTALDTIKKGNKKLEGADMANIVVSAAAEARKRAAATRDGYLPLTRGTSSIPLLGIDVPFHSKLLMSGVPTFRQVLQHTFSHFDVAATEIVDKYIPNVTGAPFKLDKSYLQQILAATGSEVVSKMIDEYEEVRRDPNAMAKELVIELLSYQFASPVQWIKTQQSLLQGGVVRFIEIGPQPTLVPMMKRSIMDVGLEFQWIGNDVNAICCMEEGVPEEEAAAPAPAAASTPAKPAAAPAPAPAAAAPPPPAAAAPATVPAARPAGAPTTSIPLTPLHALRLLVGHKLKVPFSEVDPSKSVKTLAGGKSAVQNEVLGDVANEFKAEPEGAAELSLSELASKVSSSYASAGKVLSSLSSKNLALALPGTFGKSASLAFLQATFGVDQTTGEAILVHALAHKVDKRLENDAAAMEWMRKVAQDYASANGQSLSTVSADTAALSASGAGASAVHAVVDPKEMQHLKSLFRDQVELLSSYLATKGKQAAVDEAAEALEADRVWLQHIENELDIKFLNGIAPLFDRLKIRSYDASWNWAKTEVLRLGLYRPTTKLSDIPVEDLHALQNNLTEEVLRMVEKNKEVHAALSPFVHEPSRYIERRTPMKTQTTITPQGKLALKQSPRYSDAGDKGFQAYVRDLTKPNSSSRLVLAHATKRSQTFDHALADTLMSLASSGVSFHGKTALLTGCGAGSIGLEVARCLLQAGCNVIVTTSRAARERFDMYRALYREYGGKGAKLTVIPFNGASSADCQSLAKEVGVPDYFLPFAAISENGRDITAIDGMSELAHRTMLTNVLRLMGAIYQQASASMTNSYCHVLLPLSPNHGLFGFDGLYAESKIGLECLYYKWASEGWGAYIGLVGAEIGWTKGTGLMSSNDLIAEQIELQTGVRTFDASEMAFNLVALMDERIVELARKQPLHADLSGGFANSPNGLPAGRIRRELQQQADVQKAVWEDQQQDEKLLASAPNTAPKAPTLPPVQPLSHLSLNFPPLPTPQSKPTHLEGMLDLTKVPVIVGFGEVGPWGSSATRWEAELSGKFSAEGAIQLARSLNLIKYFVGKLPKNNQQYIGWIDAKSGEPVADRDIAAKYDEYFRAHCGIRRIEPALFHGYDPKNKMFLQQLSLAADLKPFEVGSQAEAEHLKAFHGNNLELVEHDGKLMAQLKQGATIYMPKSQGFNRSVAGQLPTGWDPTRYGLPKDIVAQVDPITSYALCATMEALASAGLSDPYELYKYVHVSEVGNALGSGMGGMTALQGIFRARFLDAQGLPSDQLQESFINTTPAWINMLLLSSCGPILPPVAACATAAVSLECGVMAIREGKAKVMIVGGSEDLGEEGSYEFAQMGATSNSDAEFAAGRTPDEQCRPCTSTRNGFMESQGAGVQIVTTASLALEMGLPIYAVVAGVSTATDKQGRSIPAPGIGILSAAREAPTESDRPNPMLNIEYRRRALKREQANIEAWAEEEAAQEDADLSFIAAESARRHSLALRHYGNDFWREQPTISPMRGALAAFGLTADDISVVSFHGTSTQANDKNESNVVQLQQDMLGRSRSVPLPVITQKWLTGHPKGSAAAWMMNGLIQAMNSGVIPGNRNLDNPDQVLRKFESLVYLDRTTKVATKDQPYLTAAVYHSFGFGQAGAQAIVVHSSCLFAAVSASDYGCYVSRCSERQARANRHWLEWLTDKKPLIAIKDSPPYNESDMPSIFLSPLARATYQEETGTYKILSASGSTKSAGMVAGRDKSRLNLALKALSKNISWSNLRSSGSSSQFLHVDSKGEIVSASPSASPQPQSASAGSGSSSSSQEVRAGTAGASGSGSMRRSDSTVWSAPTNQNLNTEVPPASARGGDASGLSRVPSEAALASLGLTHSLSGLNLNAAALELMSDASCGVGVDVEEISSFHGRDASFIDRNFTKAEQQYCNGAADPAASYAGRWTAKEAVLKALSSLYTSTTNAHASGLEGPGAPLIDVEVLAPPSGSGSLAPQVVLKGRAEQLAKQINLSDIQLSISHAGTHALSLAMARSRPSLSTIRSVADLTQLTTEKK